MENLKNKNIRELFKNIDKILDFFSFHNKNLTKTQYQNIIDLIENIEEIKQRII